MKKWNWGVFGIVLGMIYIGMFSNKSFNLYDAFFVGSVIGIPLALFLARLTK